MKKSSNIDPIRGDSKDKTWIDDVSLMSLCNHDEDREENIKIDEELCYDEGVGER